MPSMAASINSLLLTSSTYSDLIRSKISPNRSNCSYIVFLVSASSANTGPANLTDTKAPKAQPKIPAKKYLFILLFPIDFEPVRRILEFIIISYFNIKGLRESSTTQFCFCYKIFCTYILTGHKANGT